MRRRLGELYLWPSRRLGELYLSALAWLLGLVNARAGSVVWSRDFYALKDRLLRTYGQRDGSDVQHLVDTCWGYEDENGCEGKSCRRCGGTGIWSDRWIELERWTLGPRVFHRPVGPIRVSVESAKEFAANVIVGRIRHGNVSHGASAEARLWLMLMFDRRTFWRMLMASRNCGWQWRPMLALQSVTFQTASFIRLFRVRPCSSCGRKFIRPDRRSYWLVCRQCSAGYDYLADAELPF